MSRRERSYFNAFNLIEGLGPVSFRQLLDHFPSLEDAWQASLTELIQSGLSQGLAEQIKKEQSRIDPDSEMEKLDRANIRLVTIKDQGYPPLLKEIYNPPALLYWRGSITKTSQKALAVVGTRRNSPYGQQAVSHLVPDLVKAGLTIVSGLAKGIDTLVHQTTLSHQGQTLAVLGSGIDDQSIYPASNYGLAQEIIKNGALISEYPLGALPLSQHFPQRNRIISGLSLATLIIEAPLKSGALITAARALEQNRDVFAVPGPIFSTNSLGPHQLIKMGAKLVGQANDVLEELNLPVASQTRD